ncbi:MAG: adenylate kinase family protein [Methanobrevibacter sp.]|jgi:adenylate kinase|nr:adenylate kinase family protein [Candidatus Methanovirga meridionalis]
MSLNYKVICITGTPGVGKTTTAKMLHKKLLKKGHESKIFSINEIAINNDLIIKYDEEKDFKIVDVEKLDKKFSELIHAEENNKNDLNSKNNLGNNNLSYTNNLNYTNNNLKFDNKELIAIVDGHLSHLCSRCDKTIVLRVNPDILKKRLIKRNYSKIKIKDNLESEVLAICSYEANEIHENKVNEIDTSDLSIYQILHICMDIIQDKNHLPIGKIDFMDYFLKGNE